MVVGDAPLKYFNLSSAQYYCLSFLLETEDRINNFSIRLGIEDTAAFSLCFIISERFHTGPFALTWPSVKLMIGSGER